MKNSFHFRVKIESSTVLVVTFLLSALCGTLLSGRVSAAIPYAEYTGTLNGADWALRIPDPWNGMLVLYCRGYVESAPNPKNTLSFLSSIQLNAGFAVAASNYGSGGHSILAGVDSTYQLTRNIIENYDVTGKVFVAGYSMGGSVALLLGEKYPDVYSGVLDAYGAKNWKHMHMLAEKWSTMTDEELSADLLAYGINRNPPDGYSSLEEFRSFLGPAMLDQEASFGGTPEDNPEGWEAVSPVYHADIRIPVISVHGTDDAMVVYYQSVMYQKAVAKSGRSSLYRLQAVSGGGHNGLYGVSQEIGWRFNELVEWSDELTGANDWPMFGYDAQRNGYSTSSGPYTNQTLWTYRIGYPLFTHPAVVDDGLYVGALNGEFYCLDAATGVLIWNYTTGGAIASNPAVFDGRVYFGSYDNNTYCLDALTGAKIWSYKTGREVISSPVVAKGKVYVGSNDGKLYCFRADYGQVEWKFTTGGEVYSSPAVADGKVYIGSKDRKVYCVDGVKGTLEWSHTTGDEVWSSPAVAEGKVYVGSTDNKIYCLDAATGALIWTYTTGDNIGISSPTIANGKVYVGSNDNNTYCLDSATGSSIWSYTTGGQVWGSPAFAGGKVYVGSGDRSFYCLDGATGTLIWSYQTNGIVYCSPVVAHGIAYAVSADRIYAFNAWWPIPEGFTVGVLLLISTIAVTVSARYFRLRQKWKNVIKEAS